MGATITWSITQMQVKPQEGQYTDVVVTASWQCAASEASGGIDYSASNYGEASFPMPSGSFTPYDQLTQEQVLGWVFAEVGQEFKANVEANVQERVANQINPPIISLPLPWAPAPAQA